MVLDPRSRLPMYRQIADVLRRRIAEEFEPGDELPTATALAREYGTGPDTVRDALAVLRSEGAVVTERGRPPRVRSWPTHRKTVTKPPGAIVRVRLLTDEERRDLPANLDVPDVPIPVFEVHVGDKVTVYLGDRTEIV